MTNEDLAQLQRLAPHFVEFKRVGVLSPREGERKLFPKAVSLPKWRWDLNKPREDRFDLLIASNVFMYSPNPQRWFRNALASCKYFLLLDLVRRKRSRDSELGADTDSMRYAVGEARPRIEPQFDLGTLGDRVLGYRTFFGGANDYDAHPLHLVALIRGDLADPIIRVDDYPTGIRPILPDLSPLHDVLHKIEERELRYYLGIVPALLTEEMLTFLRGLKSMIPTAHGYDHAYPKYAPRLVAGGDPFNRKTVLGSFNEFAGQPYHLIVSRLSEGRRRLEEGLHQAVEAYIPPCNRADRRTGRALVQAGYTMYLCSKPIAGCPLPWIRSHFSGRSHQYDYSREPPNTALHATWEADVAREGDGSALDRLLDHLADRRRAERERGTRLGGLVRQPFESA